MNSKCEDCGRKDVPVHLIKTGEKRKSGPFMIDVKIYVCSECGKKRA